MFPLVGTASGTVKTAGFAGAMGKGPRTLKVAEIAGITLAIEFNFL
jgi:hypothetical protein